MGKTREYQFVTGIETSTIPNPGTPSATNDTISLGYLEDQSYWGASVADYAAMRALTASERKNEQTRRVESTAEQWYYDASSSATDDGATILEPDDSPVTGRWLIGTSGGGGGGGGGGGIDSIVQKLEHERYKQFTQAIDNAGGLSGFIKPEHKFFEANLNRDYTASDANIYLVWNGIAFSDSDKNCDATTGFTLTGAGATLTTSATGKTVGTTALAFDKNATAVEAGVRFDRGAQTLNVSSNTRFYFWVYLPSVTGLTNVGLRMYKDTTSNFQTFVTTTNSAGGALAVGLNHCFLDLSTGGTAGGTGWLYTDLSRYQELIITTSSAGQTYTAVQFDGFYFSYRYPERLRVIGSEFDLFDNSIRQEIDIDITSTGHDGLLVLDATFASNVAGGLSGTSRGRVMRSTLLMEGDGIMIMDNDSNYSGAIVTSQSVRTGFTLRESLTGTYPVIIDMQATQHYVVTEVTSGTVFKVSDIANTIANLKNGDSIDAFSPVYMDGDTKYVFDANRAMTADATHSSGITSITVADTTGIAVGDAVVKRHLSSASLSVVAENAQENFGALSLDTSPNGIQLIDNGLSYPSPTYLYGHWELGGLNAADGARNRFGPGPTLTQTGTPNFGATALQGKFAASGLTTGNNLSAPGAPFNPDVSNNSRFQMSYWVNAASFASQQEMMCQSDSATGGYRQYITTGGVYILNTPGLDVLTGPTFTTNTWNHVFLDIIDSTTIFGYINGVTYTGTAGRNFVADPTVFTVSGFGSAGAPTNPLLTGTRVWQLMVWRGGPEVTQSQRLDIWNYGQARLMGIGPVARYQYSTSGQSGQRVTVKAVTTRTTTAIQPIISKIATIKT